MKRWLHSGVVVVISATLLACLDSGGGSGYSCPAWQVGDAMTYQTTETVSGVPTVSTATWTVTEHTDTTVSLSNGVASSVSYSFSGGNYIPVTEDYILSVDYGVDGVFDYSVIDTYSSSTPFCTPPTPGQTYEYTTWFPGPWLGTGEYVSATMTVTARTDESLSLPLGDLSVTKLVMAKTGGRADSMVTRYMAENIGVVMEVEEIPSTSTTITKELTTYSYQ